jgi:hypothetical protein
MIEEQQKARMERERELNQLSRTEAGRIQIGTIYVLRSGGAMPPIGIRGSQIIQAILEMEYPAGG